MSAAAPTYCTQKEIHAGCTLQRSCSRTSSHVGPCAGWQRSKTGKRMLGTCAACTVSHVPRNTRDNPINNPINNARNNPINNPKREPKYNAKYDAAVAARKRLIKVEASKTNPSLRGITHLSDPDLHLLAAACLNRPDVAPLFARGSKSYVYCFQSTVEDAEGWGASSASISKCEEHEAPSHLFQKNPRLRYRERDGTRRKIKRDDIFYVGSGVYIIRLVISPLLCDVTEVEKTIHVKTSADEVGFKGHIKEGGSPAEQRRFIYIVSLLVIPDLAKLHLVVSDDYLESYEAEMRKFGGREGRVVLPPAPSASFVVPPRDASGAFVLGGPRFEHRHGMITKAVAMARGVTASQEASQGEAEEDDASVASWDGMYFGKCIYFSGKTAETGGLSEEQIEAMGGEECFFYGPPSAKNKMTLLVVWASSTWRKGPKYEYALKNNIPIITFEQLKEALDDVGQEEEEEEEEDVEEEEEEGDGAGAGAGGSVMRGFGGGASRGFGGGALLRISSGRATRLDPSSLPAAGLPSSGGRSSGSAGGLFSASSMTERGFGFHPDRGGGGGGGGGGGSGGGGGGGGGAAGLPSGDRSVIRRAGLAAPPQPPQHASSVSPPPRTLKKSRQH
jgi:hypothetical protein